MRPPVMALLRRGRDAMRATTVRTCVQVRGPGSAQYPPLMRVPPTLTYWLWRVRGEDPDCFKCSAKDAASSTQYTMCQVRRHCTEESCWLVAHGNVYDVTSMVKRHPGGQRSIMRHAGQESTEDFDFHSKSGKKLYAELRLHDVLVCGHRFACPCLTYVRCGRSWGPLRIGGVIRCPSEPAKDTCLIS